MMTLLSFTDMNPPAMGKCEIAAGGVDLHVVRRQPREQPPKNV
jgi:hypothetical protein